MGHKDFVTAPLFDNNALHSTASVPSPVEQRASALKGTAAERAEFTRHVSVDVDGYRLANKYIDGLIARSEWTRHPGGFWILGDGGVGKSFILDAVYRRYPPSETQTTRYCPILILSFASRPSESDILISLLLQLGQDPGTLSYQNNSELEEILLEALPACKVLGILFDEAHHLWLNTKAKRIADRQGGRLGDFLKVFYDRSGLAYIFAGTSGLENLLESDTQASTRWAGKIKLQPFADDEKFRGLLYSLDEALPMQEQMGLSCEPLASQLFNATLGNFRLLKALLAEAVFIAASEGMPKLTTKHLALAYFAIFCVEATPFDSQ